jgi:hypothetical protein
MGLIPLCSSVAMKLSSSAKRTRSKVPGGGRELLLGHEIGDVLDHHRVLREHLPVAQAHGRHVALGAHLQVVGAVGAIRLLAEIHLGDLEGKPRLAQRDVRRDRAGTGRIEERDRHGESPDSEGGSTVPPWL